MRGRGRTLREAGGLLVLSLLLAAGVWAARTPRLPLRADVALYRLDLPFPAVDAAQALALYEAGNHLFVDTRDVDPSVTPRIPGSFAVRQATFADDLLEAHDFLTPVDPVLLYGDGDLLAVSAVASRLQQRGYADLTLLRDGLAAWRAAGGPLTGGEGRDE